MIPLGLSLLATSIVVGFALIISTFSWGIYAVSTICFVGSLKFFRDEIKEQKELNK